jgi:YHS domain-containing protein
MLKGAAAAAALGLFVLTGCAGTQDAGAPQAKTKEIGVYCPVSGDRLGAPGKAETAEYNGEKYYFCCKGCKAAFEADPGRYLGRSPR